MQTVDGNLQNQFELNLLNKSFKRREFSTTLTEMDKRNEIGFKCTGEIWVGKSLNKPIVLVGGRTLTKIVENFYKEYDKFYDARFLELPLGPFDIIEVALDVGKG